MGYVKGIAEDEKEHRIYHDRIVNGVPARPLKTDVILWAEHKDSIVVVNSYSPDAQRKRAALTAQVANREMRYDFGIYSQHESPDERNIHLFLYNVRNRIVGLLILERRDQIWRCSWETFKRGKAEELINHPPIWSVGFVWVHKMHRRRGIAQRLLGTALGHLKIDFNLLGWYTPFSEDGKSFVKQLYPEQFLIAK